MYTYKAIITKITDGDTIEANFDAGFYTWIHEDRVRFLGYNAPESKGTEKAFGKIAKTALESLISVGDEVVIKVTKADSFGRWLGEIYKNDVNIVETLVSKGYGYAWDGKGDRPSFDITKSYPLLKK